MSLSWDRLIRIYNFPVEALGDLFKSESQLEDFVMNSKAFNQLGILEVENQYKPFNTKDRLDFKGIDKEKRQVVLELKNKEGGKTAVEQVLRYAGMLKQENPKAAVRKILVTGVRGVETAKAIHGMTKVQKEDFEWYLYDYNKETEKISFSKVEPAFIAKHLK
jgi:RecB family endonuclease NucS